MKATRWRTWCGTGSATSRVDEPCWGMREELIVRAGAYLSDLHGHNIKFGD